MNNQTAITAASAAATKDYRPTAQSDAEMAAYLIELEAQKLVSDTAEMFFPGLLKASSKEAYEAAARLCTRLDAMNRRYAIAMIEGKTLVLDMYSVNPTHADRANAAVRGAIVERAYPAMIEFASLTKLHMDETVTVHVKTESKLNIADAWLKWPGHRKFARGLIFAPGASPNEVPDDRLNLFTGWGIPALAPDHKADEEACSEFLHHLRTVVCGSEEVYQWLLWWCADIVRNPQSKSGSAVVLAGKKGCGKSLVADVLRDVIGAKYFVRVSKKKDLVGEFSGHLAATMLVNCEEAMFGGDGEANDTLKDLITSPTILVNEKFLPRHTIQSHARFLFTTNSNYSHNTSEDERRFLFLDVADTFVGDSSYFDKMMGQLESGGIQAFANILHTMKRPDGVNLRKPPRTEAHTRLFAESLSIEERFFFNALVSGDNYPEDAQDEGADVAVSEVKAAFDAYVDEHAKGRSFKKSDNNFVPACMVKFWGVDLESRSRPTRNRKKETCYFVPSLVDAREMATWTAAQGGLGLSRDAVGLEDAD